MVTPIRTDPHRGLGYASLHAVYDLLWIVALVVSAPWWAWRWCTQATFRALCRERFGVALPARGARPRVLVHGFSVGEIKAAQSLVRELERTRPDLEVVLSTTTNTGAEVARKTYPHLAVVRFPLDMRIFVTRFLKRVDPACVILVELEVWPNFLREANRRGIPLAVVNGRITERSFARYRRARTLMPAFDRVSLLLAQDEEYARRFAALSCAPERVQVSGNIKIDGLRTGRIAPKPELERLLAAPTGRLCVVAGSTHEPEEALIARAVHAVLPEARLIVVPRHPERAPVVEKAVALVWGGAQRLTRLREGATVEPQHPAIVDTIGELESVYALADLVILGGSFVAHGGQNLLEPAAQERAVIHGPHMWNFSAETRLLERVNAAVQVQDEAGLRAALLRLAAEPALRSAMGARGRAAVEAQRGAAAATMRALTELLPQA